MPWELADGPSGTSEANGASAVDAAAQAAAQSGGANAEDAAGSGATGTGTDGTGGDPSGGTGKSGGGTPREGDPDQGADLQDDAGEGDQEGQVGDGDEGSDSAGESSGGSPDDPNAQAGGSATDSPSVADATTTATASFGIEKDLEEAIAPLQTKQVELQRRLDFYEMWESGEAGDHPDPEVRQQTLQNILRKHGLPEWDKRTSVQRSKNQQDIDNCNRELGEVSSKIKQVDGSVGKIVRAIGGMSDFQGVVLDVLRTAGVRYSDEAFQFILDRSTKRGGAAWLADTKRAAADIRAAALAARKGKPATGTAGGKAQAAKPGQQQQPKARVTQVGTGKSGGSAGGGSAQAANGASRGATGAPAQNGLSATDAATFAEMGMNPAEYTGEQRARILSEYRSMKAPANRPAPAKR